MLVDVKINKPDKIRDLRSVPAYGINEAAHYLGLPKATLRSWVISRDSLLQLGQKMVAEKWGHCGFKRYTISESRPN